MKIRINKNAEKRKIGDKEYFMGESFGKIISISDNKSYYDVDVFRDKESIFTNKDIHLQSAFIYYPYTKEYEINKKFQNNSVY